MAQRSDPLESPSPASVGLTERETVMLAFEHRPFGDPGAKEEAIRAEFGIGAARYYQVLNALIDSPAAIVKDPMLVSRLQRVREARTSARVARTGGSVSAGRALNDD